ncbi:general substrate transporter [Pleomassaria siparia CBS 279.74]|uniref:General substrate transporter n=1 Tax=Pleomassaria siparia CBS 279.74 TaxID=1314801 RepID=A0A6G1KAX1_9PLEO|nr:general substrate transporter [Pleomassaria siparia CBS 279.74]
MYLNNILGRKLSLVMTGVISIIGVLIEITSTTGGKPRFGQFVAGKTIASVAMGLAVNIVPIYLSETSTGAARGFAVSLYQNVQILGVILAAGVVYASSRNDTPSAYLIPMGIQFIAPTIMVLGSPFLPESPRWLVWKGRHDDAVTAANRLFASHTNGFDASKYINDIQIAIDAERDRKDASRWADLMHGPDLRRLLIAVGIQSLQQAQGSSYMNSYIVSFLESTGVTNVFPVIMGLYTLYYVAILTGHFLPDTVGRRPILMSTGTFCGFCLIIVSSLVVAYDTPSAVTKKASIALIFLWELSFGVQSPLIWITTAESAPTRNREKVQAIACFFGFGVSLLITSVSPYIQNKGYGDLGGKIGFIWGAFSLVTVAWVFFTVPEMKGFSIEQLDYLYNNKVPTLRFKGYRFDGDGTIVIDGKPISVDDVDEKRPVIDAKASEAKASETESG